MIRRIQEEDFGALLACWNASAEFDHIPESVFRDKLDDDGYRDDLAWVHVDDGSVCGLAIGVVREGDLDTKGSKGYVKMLAVRPENRRRRIGSELLKRLLKQFERSGIHTVRVGESSPNYLTPGLDVRYEAGLYLFEKHGFRRVGEAYDMEVRMSDLADDTISIAERAGADGIDFRRASEADWDELKRLLAQHWPSWIPEVWRSMQNTPASVHVAALAGNVVAFSAFEGNNAGLGTFGPMGTAPAFRGRGLGEILLRHCLNDLSAMGYERVTIPWVAPVGFYAQTVGATIKRVFLRLEKTL